MTTVIREYNCKIYFVHLCNIYENSLQNENILVASGCQKGFCSVKTVNRVSGCIMILKNFLLTPRISPEVNFYPHNVLSGEYILV